MPPDRPWASSPPERRVPVSAAGHHRTHSWGKDPPLWWWRRQTFAYRVTCPTFRRLQISPPTNFISGRLLKRRQHRASVMDSSWQRQATRQLVLAESSGERRERSRSSHPPFVAKRSFVQSSTLKPLPRTRSMFSGGAHCDHLEEVCAGLIFAGEIEQQDAVICFPSIAPKCRQVPPKLAIPQNSRGTVGIFVYAAA
jgi:hypothetical protein